MDTEIILKRKITDEDKVWLERLRAEIEPKYSTLERLDIDLIEEKEFHEPQKEQALSPAEILAEKLREMGVNLDDL
mgnify:FL=1